MEQEVIHLLEATTSSIESTRRTAESQILNSYSNPAFPVTLLAIAQHSNVQVYLRQSALINFKQYIVSTWAPQHEQFKGIVYLDDATKSKLRNEVLALCLGQDGQAESKITRAANGCASMIAVSDFPSQWPELLPSLLQIVSGPTSADAQVHGALRLLAELVESGFTEEQFFAVAKDLVGGIFTVATRAERRPITKALALSVLRECFDTLEMVMEEHEVAVKAFLHEALRGWIPFFFETMKAELPEPPSQGDETKEEGVPSTWRGLVALKLQVVKTLCKIRKIFPSILTPHSTVLFSSAWEELSRLQPAYQAMFINDERQGRLEDSDSLPYTLDWLILEELDFMTSFLRAPPVRSELEGQLKSAPSGPHNANWLQEVLKLAISYAQVSTEQEGLWDMDLNVFLSDEVQVTANYGPREACADLVIKGLGEWLKLVPVDALLAYLKILLTTQDAGWKTKEAGLFLLNTLLRDLDDYSTTISIETSKGFLDLVGPLLQSSDTLLRARAYLVSGILAKTVKGADFQPTSLHYLSLTADAIGNDPEDIVRVACIQAAQDFLKREAHQTPSDALRQLQAHVIAVLSDYVSSHDLREEADSDEDKVALTETLRDAIYVWVPVVLEGPAIDLLFTIASHGATNFQLTSVFTEAFEHIVQSMTQLGPEKYNALCEKVLPSLTGAFDVGNLTEESALTNLAAELVAALAENGPEPLPDGFVAAIMPKLNRVLTEASEAELLRPATVAVKHMLAHGHVQFFQWHDPVTRKGAVEVLLIIVDRLLSPGIDDNAASEIGGLAVELVEKAGSERLGPFLPQLLTAVAQRLYTAEAASFIQSLCLVFARLCLNSAKEVLDFLAQVDIHGQNGLGVVVTKWVDNSINFAGYDETRQNVIALSKLYSLHDSRVGQIQVKGDLIIEDFGRIKTRSRAKLNPDRYTVIPADLKILKILVEELYSNMTNSFRNGQAATTAAAANGESEGSEDGDDWEDLPSGSLDLGSGLTKQQLMSLGGIADADGVDKQWDSETAEFLMNFFKEISQTGEFQTMYPQLTDEEQRKLQSVSS